VFQVKVKVDENISTGLYTIGRYAFIGAGAVLPARARPASPIVGHASQWQAGVTKDVRDHALILENPTEISGWMCECGNQLIDLQTEIPICNDCGKEYTTAMERHLVEYM
jgi:UDP-2-acetamido-3-amino-2,3-dideoxy-glucuronate N-acetyltransferase